jgi:hypothetical protein
MTKREARRKVEEIVERLSGKKVKLDAWIFIQRNQEIFRGSRFFEDSNERHEYKAFCIGDYDAQFWGEGETWDEALLDYFESPLRKAEDDIASYKSWIDKYSKWKLKEEDRERLISEFQEKIRNAEAFIEKRKALLEELRKEIG